MQEMFHDGWIASWSSTHLYQIFDEE